MDIKDEILINKYGQDLVTIEHLVDKYLLLDLEQKRSFLNELLYLIIQSKPKVDDIMPAIFLSGLKSTFTPCVLLQKGVNDNNLRQIINLPEAEMTKSFKLLVSLFKIAYKRRFDLEKNTPNKWWYWDLSDDSNIQRIIS